MKVRLSYYSKGKPASLTVYVNVARKIMDIKWLEGNMAVFLPGSSHSAKVNIDVDPANVPCQLELWLGPNQTTKTVTSGMKSFTSTGQPQDINCTVVMPSSSGVTYHVYIDVYIGGQLAAGFQASEDVTIVSVGTPGVVWT